MTPKSEEEVKNGLRKFFRGDDAPPAVLALSLLLNEFEVECRAILPRRRWLMIGNRCLSGREETGEALLVMDCARWLAKYTFNKLIYIGGAKVLAFLLHAVRSELNEPTTKQTLELKKTIVAGPYPEEHKGEAPASDEALQPAVKVSASFRAGLLMAAENLLAVTSARGYRLETTEKSALAAYDVAELDARQELHAAIVTCSATVAPETDVRLVAAARNLLKVTGKRGAALVRMKTTLGDANAAELHIRGYLGEILAKAPNGG